MNRRSESGFSYIDVMIALVILMVGILALLSGISASILQSKGHEQQLVAKQMATSTMESIMAVKETDPARLGWNAIGNVGTNPDVNGVNQGIFPTGLRDIYMDPGPDEVIGTTDDTGTQVQAMQRSIVITDVCDPDRPSPNCTPSGTSAIRIRSVTVTVRYFVGRMQREEVLQTVLTDYAVAN